MRRQVPGSPRQGLHMGNCSAPSLTSCSTPKVLEKMEQVLEDRLLQERKEHAPPSRQLGKPHAGGSEIYSGQEGDPLLRPCPALQGGPVFQSLGFRKTYLVTSVGWDARVVLPTPPQGPELPHPRVALGKH